MKSLLFIQCVLLAFSCTYESQQAELQNPVDNTATSNFGTIQECALVSDSAMLIATTMAYYHDALIEDGIDSFLVRHNRLSSFYWGPSPESLILVDTVIARYSRTFLIDEQIVEDFFEALETHGNVLQKTGGISELEEALYCLANGNGSPVYLDNSVIRPRGLFTWILQQTGNDGPCTPAGIFARMGDAAVETLGAIGSGGNYIALRVISGGSAFADLYDYYSYMLGC